MRGRRNNGTNKNSNGTDQINENISDLITQFFSFKDCRSLAAGLVIRKLSLAIFNYYRKIGKIKRMEEYDYMCSDEDIIQDICRCLLQYKHKYNPALNPQRKPTFKDLTDACQEIFTSTIHDTCQEIDRIIETKNGKIVISDRKFQKFRKKYKQIESVSKRNTKSVNSYIQNEDDNTIDFFEKNKIDQSYFPSPEEIFIRQCEESESEEGPQSEESSFVTFLQTIRELCNDI